MEKQFIEDQYYLENALEFENPFRFWFRNYVFEHWLKHFLYVHSTAFRWNGSHWLKLTWNCFYWSKQYSDIYSKNMTSEYDVNELISVNSTKSVINMNFILETREHIPMEGEGGNLTYLQKKLYSIRNLLPSHESGVYQQD